MVVIIWLNGGFAAGKTTLAGELHQRLPDAVVYDPEDVGVMLWKWMLPNDEVLAAAGLRSPACGCADLSQVGA